mmetsp:Transcript_34225/g.33463  ORF Transcript_34225/g.33463 Transcript_34225/m.33463 type:complete len:105 (+) Transcript_34225:225-539(+)
MIDYFQDDDASYTRNWGHPWENGERQYQDYLDENNQKDMWSMIWSWNLVYSDLLVYFTDDEYGYDFDVYNSVRSSYSDTNEIITFHPFSELNIDYEWTFDNAAG